MPGLPLLQFDLRSCPLPDACVDGIACLNVLEHIDDHFAAMQHLYRIVKSGGIVHLEVPAGPGLYDIFDEHFMHHRRYRMNELVRISREAGFQVPSTPHLGFLPFPFFWDIKKLNRRKLKLPAAKKEKLVAKQIRQSRQSGLLTHAIRLETTLGRIVNYPIGIRCVAVLTKT